MRKYILMLGLALSLQASLASCSAEQQPEAKAKPSQSPEQQIRAAHTDWPIKGVNVSPIDGLYEVQVGDQIAYSDASGRYVIHSGHMIDMNAKKDLTQARLEELNKVDWSILPLDKAVVSGDPDATTRLAVFTDPECPFCRNLEKMLKDVHGVKVYTFLFPLTSIHPNARAKAEAIWCDKDQHAMLQKIMLENFIPEKSDCATPIDDLEKLAGELSIHGTPALIAGDGRRMSGAPRTVEALQEWLAKK